MSQDNLVRLRCDECKRVNYHTSKNKKTLRDHRLELKKLCQNCGKHTTHKESK